MAKEIIQLLKNSKKFNFSGRKITFREQFKEERKFEDLIPKLINYSKIFLDDYKLDKTFEYINRKEDKDKKIEKYISKIFYNLSFNSKSFLADELYKDKIISEEERKNINENLENLLKNNEEIFNYHYSNLSYFYLSNMSQKLFNFFENQSSDFQDENTKEKFLGILIYSFRISFISLITENKEYFYGNILFIKDNDLLNFLNESFVSWFSFYFKKFFIFRK